MAQIQSLAQELPYAVSAAIKKKKKIQRFKVLNRYRQAVTITATKTEVGIDTDRWNKEVLKA